MNAGEKRCFVRLLPFTKSADIRLVVMQAEILTRMTGETYLVRQVKDQKAFGIYERLFIPASQDETLIESPAKNESKQREQAALHVLGNMKVNEKRIIPERDAKHVEDLVHAWKELSSTHRRMRFVVKPIVQPGEMQCLISIKRVA